MERTLRFWWNLRSMTVVWCPIFHKKIIGLTQWGGRHPPFCVFFVPLKIVDRQPIPILVRIEFCKKFLKIQLIWLGFFTFFFSFFFFFFSFLTHYAGKVQKKKKKKPVTLTGNPTTATNCEGPSSQSKKATQVFKLEVCLFLQKMINY